MWFGHELGRDKIQELVTRKDVCDGPLRTCTECENICVPHEFHRAPTGGQLDEMGHFVRVRVLPQPPPCLLSGL